jgi:hypothetical protein
VSGKSIVKTTNSSLHDHDYHVTNVSAFSVFAIGSLKKFRETPRAVLSTARPATSPTFAWASSAARRAYRLTKADLA